jgi:tetratricopeptide (TPR) repeat protein
MPVTTPIPPFPGTPGSEAFDPPEDPRDRLEFRQALDLVKRNRLIEAEIACSFILRDFPDDYDALNLLAQLLLKRGDGEGALPLLRRALCVNPGSAKAFRNLGDTLAALEREEESIEAYQSALRIDPDDAAVHNNLGLALRVEGRLTEAAEEFAIAINLRPQVATFYYNLCIAKKTAHGDSHVKAMEQMAANEGQFAPARQIELYFGLGKAYADLGLMERAFDCLAAGNSLKRQLLVYDERNALRNLSQIRTFFSAERVRGREGGCDPSELPVFICGFPRSGTTLVEQIIASHPAAFGAGELSCQVPEIECWAASTDRESLTGARSDISGEVLRGFGARHIERLRALAPGAQRVVDKSMTNFQIAGLIHLALPKARMIYVSRDPVDTCLSCFSTLFRATYQPWTYDLGELGRYYNAYRGLMEHWRRVLPPEAMIEVAYEDIVTDLPGQARRLLEFCGLDWDDACLSFHKTERSVRTASVNQVRQPLYNSSVGRWRPNEEVLRPLIAGLACKPA